MVALSCPHCSNSRNVIKHGVNRSGTARCRCRECRKTFTPTPRNRTLTPDKEAAIERALGERIPQSGIARLFKVSRNTVRAVRKRGRCG